VTTMMQQNRPMTAMDAYQQGGQAPPPQQLMKQAGDNAQVTMGGPGEAPSIVGGPSSGGELAPPPTPTMQAPSGGGDTQFDIPNGEPQAQVQAWVQGYMGRPATPEDLKALKGIFDEAGGGAAGLAAVKQAILAAVSQQR